MLGDFGRRTVLTPAHAASVAIRDVVGRCRCRQRRIGLAVTCRRAVLAYSLGMKADAPTATQTHSRLNECGEVIPAIGRKQTLVYSVTGMSRAILLPETTPLPHSPAQAAHDRRQRRLRLSSGRQTEECVSAATLSGVWAAVVSRRGLGGSLYIGPVMRCAPHCLEIIGTVVAMALTA